MNASQKRRRSASSRPQKRKKTTVGVPATLQMRRPEKKSVDVPATLANFTSAGTFTLLNGIIPGASVNQRVGRKISMKSISIRGMVYWSQAGATPGNDYLRCILFYDRQPNGAAPSVADLLTDTDNAGGTTSTAISDINISNADRFKVLRDWYWDIPMPSSGTTPQNAEVLSTQRELVFKDFVPLKGMEVHFNAGTAGTVADIATGSLYLLTIGLRAAADYQFSLRFKTRLRYLDQ